MAYQWWVFAHLLGVFGFLAAHGVSMTTGFRLRKERDPAKVVELVQLSSSSTRWFYGSFLLLGITGIAAATDAGLWSQFWVGTSVVVVVVVTGVMLSVGKPYYRKVGVVARAKAGGSKAVSDKDFDELLRSRRSDVVIAVGVLGLVALLYLMLFKPTLSSATAPTPTPVATGSSAPGGVPAVHETAGQVTFGSTTLQAPANTPFDIVFDNQAPGVAHNVAIYTNSSASTVLFRGALVTGVKTVTYHVPALKPGTYFFRCDVHPTQMTGTFVVK
ncbi:MAG TPA: cupredoxin domain-containing protein [Actinomycetota bacterium]|nr:cupredoxin domain-containing protein [Actinomycetota bacterium]